MSDDSLLACITDSNNACFPIAGMSYCSSSSSSNSSSNSSGTPSGYKSSDTSGTSDRQEFIALVKDISGYLNAVKKMGIVSYNLSMESIDMIKCRGRHNRSVLRRESPAMLDKQAFKKLSFLSLNGAGDLNAGLFFIICNKKINNKKINNGKISDTKPATDKLNGIYQGDAGELFLKILKAMKLGKDSVYTSCITMSDLSGHKREISMEMDICMDLIKKQIDYVCPEIICCLGDLAVKAFLGSNHPLSVSRGRFYNYKGIKVMPTFHPASLIMDTSKKRYVWDDMQKIMSLLGI